MTQHRTVLWLISLINIGHYTTHDALKIAYAAGFDRGRDRNNEAIPVLQLSLDGDYIEVHDSMTQAAEVVDLSITSISKAAHGKFRTSGGYKWRILNE